MAAARLHLTRSAVTKIIARLEQRLDTRLFHRTTRTLSLTEGGQDYYEHCLRALAELDAGEAALDSGRREPSGRLRISAPVLFGRQCIAPVLIGLLARHARLSIEMSFSDRVVDVIDEGFDLAVRVGELPDSTVLASRRLGAQRMAICAAPAYLRAQGRPESLEDVATHAAIVYGRNGLRKSWSMQHPDGTVRQVEPSHRIVLDDLQAITDAALAGLGLAWLPCWMIEPHVAQGRLELVFDCDRVAATDIHVVWPKTRHLPAKTRIAIDALAAEVPEHLSSLSELRRTFAPDLAPA